MRSIYKSAEGEHAVRERYLEILKRWPVPNQQLRVPTREGETFIVACGDESETRVGAGELDHAQSSEALQRRVRGIELCERRAIVGHVYEPCASRDSG